MSTIFNFLLFSIDVKGFEHKEEVKNLNKFVKQ